MQHLDVDAQLVHVFEAHIDIVQFAGRLRRFEISSGSLGEFMELALGQSWETEARDLVVDDPVLARERADDERAVAGHDLWRRGRLLCGNERGRRDERDADDERECLDHGDSRYGKMRSILRQSFCAAAHLLVQSGA